MFKIFAEIIRISAASRGSAAFHAHDFDVARKKPVRRAEHAAWLLFCDWVLISYRVCFVFLVAGCRIDTGLLRLAILEEVNCNLREQCIGEDILILLLPLCDFLLVLRKGRLKIVRRAIVDYLRVADALLLGRSCRTCRTEDPWTAAEPCRSAVRRWRRR